MNIVIKNDRVCGIMIILLVLFLSFFIHNDIVKSREINKKVNDILTNQEIIIQSHEQLKIVR